MYCTVRLVYCASLHCSAPHCAALHPTQLVYGGAGQQSHALSDMWLFNTKASTWERMAVTGALQLPGREMHSAVMVDDTHMLVYGGRGSDGK